MTTTGCTGASAGLVPDQCAAWGKFFDGAGGPQWTGYGQGCTKENPCGSCNGNVICSGSSITQIDLESSNLHGTVSDAASAFVDLEQFDVYVNSLTGSLPAALSASWQKVMHFDVGANEFTGIVPSFDFGGMTFCTLLSTPPTNSFSCPWPPGATEWCTKNNRSPITNADCDQQLQGRRGR